jgi:hypothetical protein
MHGFLCIPLLFSSSRPPLLNQFLNNKLPMHSILIARNGLKFKMFCTPLDELTHFLYRPLYKKQTFGTGVAETIYE